MNSTTSCQPGEHNLTPNQIFSGSRQTHSTVTRPAGAPVSWQTIFWTLLPLAISSMTQPGGRVCGLPSFYRTYLRCSPILCAADAFSVISQVAVLYLYQKQRFLEAIGLVLHGRFNADEHSEL
ncbi:hypothetical protein N431DRAFT_82228 [Stipitochalara longipes BDJ]|nr:hypothetical protein N431DRAFT_82228 [Stipitochalara longipes BDJ]